mmetsp:Transcript_56317/g.121356  ORF Transcript_56317/g.121356 Transcript_56317/m.121356 type:complete len:117 (+) Transcript_56317:118-468(+)|eukprot:CAMPEP_0180462806 /NCGR_PEP_ID=MMETSP1036_2-20121128/24600_1 /TAXON_ID=632150 /ORGANISM="Azadinium spinosum, Strain 3D9" /LENGTH=116 /DNA_ID=CAMNT_0022469601 /DNA_START=118 /DNA_END=468 /DNA_ORIENTATION=+
MPMDPALRYRPFQHPTLYEGVTSVKVEIEGDEEEVLIDPKRGPLLRGSQNLVVGEPMMFKYDSGTSWHQDRGLASANQAGRPQNKTWTHCTASEQTVMIHTVAKKQRKLRERSELE